MGILQLLNLHDNNQEIEKVEEKLTKDEYTQKLNSNDENKNLIKILSEDIGNTIADYIDEVKSNKCDIKEYIYNNNKYKQLDEQKQRNLFFVLIDAIIEFLSNLYDYLEFQQDAYDANILHWELKK